MGRPGYPSRDQTKEGPADDDPTEAYQGEAQLAGVGLLLGNVSEACRTLGYSRDTFYRLKKRYEEDGLEGAEGDQPPQAESPKPCSRRDRSRLS